MNKYYPLSLLVTKTRTVEVEEEEDVEVVEEAEGEKVEEDDEYLNVYYWICHFQHVHMGFNLHDQLGS